MVKSELIARIAGKFQQLSEADVEIGINRVLERMSEALAKGERIEIRGFGSFSLHHHPARNAHNPRTGEKVLTMPKYSPHFRPGKQFRDRVNEAKVKNIPIIVDEKDSDV